MQILHFCNDTKGVSNFAEKGQYLTISPRIKVKQNLVPCMKLHY